jgi:uncharacterized membrane protein YeaQ/YmgE (transglycosylase-associated protein family)
MIVYLITLFFVGLVVGALARLALPGPDPMSLLQTVLVGIAGSFIAGLLVWAVHGRGGAGIVLSVLCSTGIVYVVRRTRGGSLTDPGRPALDRRRY